MTTEDSMTDSLKKALLIIDTTEVTHAGQFAYLMWPDSPAWKKLGRCGNGVAAGVGIKLAGGGYLGKLCKRGLITPTGLSWRLTSGGKQKLQDFNADEQRRSWHQAMANSDKADCSQCSKHDFVCVCGGHCYDCCQCTPDDLPDY